MRVLGLRRGRGSVWKREEGEVEGGLGRRRRDWAGRFVRVVMAGSVSRFRERERERNDGVCYLELREMVDRIRLWINDVSFTDYYIWFLYTITSDHISCNLIRYNFCNVI